MSNAALKLEPVPAQIMDSSGQVWAVDFAISLEAAQHAVAMARLTGTVGCTEVELTSVPGVEKLLATVHRLDDSGNKEMPH